MKLRKLAFTVLFAATSAVFAAGAPAQNDKPKPPPPKAYLTADEGGIAFKLQGEYEGTVAGAKAGVQVIALKDGAFRAVMFPGGLPGAGSDGKTKVEADGKLAADKVAVAGPLNVSVDGQTLVGKTAKGETIEMKKVMRQSPTLGAKPPAGATVLFDGTNLDAWTPNSRMENGLLLASSNPRTKQEFKDFTLHVEFWLPFMPDAGGQGRANSGVYIQGRYELQVLDSLGLKGVDNECGGIYKNAAPSVNMCLPPLQWQTYDIDFQAVKLANGQKTGNAVVTVKHNGVIIHDKLELKGATPGGPKSKGEFDDVGPIFFQNHGNPVMYRNIWIVEKK
jgi:hypothetical protein